MKKGNAFLVLIVLIIFTALGWYCTISVQAKDAEAYKNLLEKAARYEEKEIYIDAVGFYEEALLLKPGNYDLVVKKMELYLKLGDAIGFISSCDEAIAIDSKNPKAYIEKAHYYIERSNYSEAIDVINDALAMMEDNEEIKELKNEIGTKFIRKYVSYDEVGSWHVHKNSDYVVFKDEGKWGVCKKDGATVIREKYDYLGAYDETTSVLPCVLDGEYYFIDIKGNRKLVGEHDYEYLGSFGNGVAPAKYNNVYGYLNAEFKEKDFIYEYAGSFANNVAAVKKDGKWALINREFSTITDFEYDEILMDSYGYCSMYNIIIAKQGEKYLFLNREGKQIGNTSFDGVSLPASSGGMIAIKQGELWGFADVEGNIVIEPKYTAAKSFALGLAPVLEEGKWGYIDTNGVMVIEPQFLDAEVFSAKGSAPVYISSSWCFIVLCEYD